MKLSKTMVPALAIAALLCAAYPAVDAAADGKSKINAFMKKALGDKNEKKAKVAKKATPAPTCNAINSLGVCYAFSGKKNYEEKPGKGNEMGCKFMKGRYIASDTCPVAKAMGECVVKAGEPEEYSLYYYEGGRFSRSKAEKDCGDAKSGIHAQGAGKWKSL